MPHRTSDSVCSATTLIYKKKYQLTHFLQYTVYINMYVYNATSTVAAIHTVTEIQSI